VDWLGLFYSPIKPFVAHPDRAAAIATVLLVMFLVFRATRRVWPWPLLWATGLWAAYAIWEWVILLQEANIRVDLFFIYPVLLVVTLWALWSGLRTGASPHS
jgi:CDP-diglyceride synthetase